VATFDSQELIQNLISRAQTKIKTQFMAIVAQLQRENSLDDLAELIAKNDINGALELLDAAANRLANTINGIFLSSGASIMEALADKLDVVVSFDHVNNRAVQLMQANQLELVTNFTAEQRLATSEALTQGVADGLNPREMARAFRDSIGLTRNQVLAVDNYESMLENLDSSALLRELRDARFDPTIRSAIDDDRALSPSEIERMVERYRQRMLKYRANRGVAGSAPSVRRSHDAGCREWNRGRRRRATNVEIGARQSRARSGDWFEDIASHDA